MPQAQCYHPVPTYSMSLRDKKRKTPLLLLLFLRNATLTVMLMRLFQRLKVAEFLETM